MQKQKSPLSPNAQKAPRLPWLAELWPSRCVACGAWGSLGAVGLCPACRRGALLNGAERCELCDVPASWTYASEGQRRRCPTCRAHRPAYAQLRAPWLYCGPLRLWLLAAQRRPGRSLVELARWLLVDAAVRAWTCADDAELVPIPADPAVRLAHAVGRMTGRPVRALLARRTAEDPAAGTQERAPTFELAQPGTLAARTLVLVDATVSSGRTCAAAAATLCAAHAPPPRVIAVARTPP